MSTRIDEQTVIGITMLTGEILLARVILDPKLDFRDESGSLYVEPQDLKKSQSVILKDPVVVSMQPHGQPDDTGRTAMAVGFAPFQPSASGTPQYISSDKILAWFFPAPNLESAYIQMTSGIVIPRPKVPGNQNGKLVGI